ncbi:hypothetical protein HPB52_020771 [Rhipicephalus sanguineus]|uniref:Scavenger receptor class B member 1 n=1 Tax=Rhipicephalus sanguineus TaxID=34632 RepID=A0A9D4T321_RHISA|nr:hypothetical protein HPB52_020771 [Rhipicephalus sanguineus]
MRNKLLVWHSQEVSLSKHSRAFPMWKDPSHETKIRFFFFNVTNPNEVLIGEKPSVKEVGPYTYRANWIKHNITFHDNGTMSYKETKRYYFDRASSVGPESDEIMTVNVPFVTTAQLLKEQNFIIRGIASLSLSGLGQRIFISRSVGQLTFGGYPDILVLLGSVIDSGRPRPGQPGFNIGDVFSHGYRTVIDMLGSLVDPDKQGTNGKFGYMVNKNDTIDGEYTIFTGEDDISKVNQVYEFNKHRKLEVWPGDECNTLTGTLGHIRPPLSKSNEQVMFIPDICRSIPLESIGYESFKGLKVKRFIAGPTAFDSGQQRSENECFAAGRTLPDGGANLGPCKQGAPLVLSFPHFLYADSSYRADVDGMNPDPNKHQFFFNSEPTLGVTVNVRGRIQVSVVLERVFGLGPFSRVAEGVLPLFWQETRVEAKEDTVKLLRTIVQLPEYSQWGSVGLIIISSVLLAASTFLLFRPRVTRREITKVQPIAIDVKKPGDATCGDMFPNKVERILQNGLDRIPNSFGITAVRNNFINELKNTRRTSEPSAPAEINIYKTLSEEVLTGTPCGCDDSEIKYGFESCSRVTWVKENITWNSNGTISYREVKTYFFDRNESVGTEEDQITTINAPLVAAGVLLDKIPNPLKRRAIAIFINILKEKPVSRHTVGELLFDGYKDLLVIASQKLDPTLPPTDGKFGWMMLRNGSNDGLFTVYTGKGEMDKYNVITRWNGLQNMTWWNGTCNMINGTNGELVPPLKPGQEFIEIYSPDFCRSFRMQHSGSTSMFAIPLERFVAPETTFQNGENYSANACFDTKRKLRSGAMDLGPCQHDLPVALSFPHFYMADPYYLEQVEGLQPNGSLHRFQLDLEPKLGLTVSLRGRIQLNMVLKKNRLITGLTDIPEIVYPVLWEEINIELDKALADYLKSTLENPMFYSTLFAYLLLALGGLLLLIIVAFIAGRAASRLLYSKDVESKSLLVDTDEALEAAAAKNHQNEGEVIT